jgi:hypothetical protein
MRKQQVKAQLWHAGNVVRTLKNCSWPEERYNRVAFIIFRTAFEKIRYLNSELIRGKIDFPDVSSLEREKRVEDAVIPRSPEATFWSDNSEVENASLSANSWTVALGKFMPGYVYFPFRAYLYIYILSYFALDRCVKRLQEGGAAAAAADKDKRPVTASFHALSSKDQPLVEVLHDWNVKDAGHVKRVAQAAEWSSYAGKDSARLIGLLMWVAQYKGAAARLPLYLKECFDNDVLPEEAIRAWHAASPEQVLQTVPASALIGAAQVTAMQNSAKPFVQWLDQASDDEEEGSEEEED